MKELSQRFEGVRFAPFWPDTTTPPVTASSMNGELLCDIAIVGAGFTGLWAALKARERYPDARIAVLEGRKLAQAASGRSGGFAAPSISHGVMNAVTRWPSEAEKLIRLGRENLNQMEDDLATYEIDAEFERSGKLNLARTPWESEGLASMAETYKDFGIEGTFLSGNELDGWVNTPRYSAGLFEPNYAYVNPAKLVVGLARACIERGILIFEGAWVDHIKQRADRVQLTTQNDYVLARKVVLASNADRPLLGRLRSTIIPIFDYSIMTEPLSSDQLSAIGWQGRYGVADSGNQFHYSRKTEDNRILWGGYDAIYYAGSKRNDGLLDRYESYAQLEQNFLATFPELSDVKFSYAWGGIIDTSARLTHFVGAAMGGRVAYAAGFTGQGVTASRFAALSMLDLLEGAETERTSLRMTRSLPVPFPPEPFRNLAIRWAQADLAKEDENGRRSSLLKLMDRIGIGFGS
ncbi:NAD(P)/FAD-dependent oxidoreductase [Celeribacter naphthalenivorans]|uniref:NAD(P)/FAD-dependent oxidoreductase n=1 Tax=Celeribacter naphthalenivorans TaxID=1614694 RepID=UPI001CFACD34|nr:FAD-dependent oxidoreductase [Celeribacter naphthalenivorans]